MHEEVVSTCATYRPPSGAGTVSGDVVARSSVLAGATLLAVKAVAPGGAPLATTVTRDSRIRFRKRRKKNPERQAFFKAEIKAQRDEGDAGTHKAPEYPGGQMHSPVTWTQVPPLRHWQGS